MRGVTKVEKNASGSKPSVPINLYNPREYVDSLNFNDLPEGYKEVLENAVRTLLDPDSGKVVITGGDQSGKTFFGAQILYTAENFIGKYGLGSFYPLRMTRSDYNELAPFIESIADYLHRVADEMDIEISEICVFTDHTDVASRISESGTGVRIVLEAPEPMYMAMSKAQSNGITSVWSGWDVFNVSGIYLRRRELVEMIYSSQKERLASHYSAELKRKHIVAIINALMTICRAMRLERGDSNNPYLVVAPSHVSVMTRRLIQILSSEENPNELSQSDIANAIDKVFGHVSHLVEDSHTRAHILTSENENDSITISASSPEEARAALEAAGVELSEEEEQKLFQGVFDDVEDPKPISNGFRGKFRSINVLEKNLKKAIIGQDSAIEKVVNSLSIPAAGMHSPKKPLRTLLFLGPTGVGKTELSLQIAENLFTDSLNVIRLDMSEFSTEGSTTSLFGATPGYVGYSEDGGTLTREVAKHPHSLIILDEIEKARPSTWDAFLQIFDAGRMTTGSGKVVDFSNCVIVMTSNLGTEEMTAKGIGFGDTMGGTRSAEELEAIAHNALKKYFRLEFINRIDETVVFNKLDNSSARRIVEKELREVSKLIEPRGHSLAKVSTDILDSILLSSKFSEFGAREIQRTIQRKVSVPLARLILEAGKSPKKFKLKKSGDANFAVSEA